MILETNDYDIFIRSVVNRDKRKTKLLRDSMIIHGFHKGFPLICTRREDGKLVVKCGHHRLDVAISLKLKVYYVVCDSDISIVEFEDTSNKWTLKDYVTGFARTGSPDYLLVLNWCARSELPLGLVISLLRGEYVSCSHAINEAKHGLLVVKNDLHMATVTLCCQALKSKDYAWATSQNFATAMSLSVAIPEFNIDAWLHQIKLSKKILCEQKTRDDYLNMIEKVMNNRSKAKIPVSFWARTIAESIADAKTQTRKLGHSQD